MEKYKNRALHEIDTILSIRIASVMEYEKGMSFHKTLDKEDRKLLDDMASRWDAIHWCM